LGGAIEPEKAGRLTLTDMRRTIARAHRLDGARRFEGIILGLNRDGDWDLPINILFVERRSLSKCFFSSAREIQDGRRQRAGTKTSGR
jgi:hypothetical protein